MKIIHGNGYSISELNSFKSIIHGNLFSSMLEVIEAMDKLNIKLHNSSNLVCASRLSTVQHHCGTFQQRLEKT